MVFYWMSERTYRFIIGLAILISLFLEYVPLMWAVMGIYLLEAITNWRLPIIISRARYGENYESRMMPAKGCQAVSARINFDAERVLRIVVVSLLYLTYILFFDVLWFFPYLIGIMLLAAGVSNICPMLLLFRWAGFK